MRYIRRLPPLLRMASLLGLLFPLASLALLVSWLVTGLRSFSRSPPEPDVGPGLFALNLGLLGGVCSCVVTAYSTRFRRPDGEPFPLGSWQSQLRAILLLAALPSCALVVALFIPPTPPAFFLVSLLDIAISLLGAVVLLAAFVWPPVGASARD
jgi:hypothetical protein